MAAQTAWQPELGQMRQLVGYLRDALSGHDQNAQRNATMVIFSNRSAIVVAKDELSPLLTDMI